MLPGLGHRSIIGCDDEDCSIHLGGAGDHVLNVICVAGGVNVSVVPLVGLVLYVGNIDGDAALLLFGGGVNLVKLIFRVYVGVFVVKNLGDGRGQSGLAVVNVPDGSHVYVRLGALVFGLFCH